MNNVLLAQINGLTAKYEKEMLNFKFTNDEFAIFDFEYKNYYKPFAIYILPEMARIFKNNPREKFQDYESLIHKRYVKALYEEMTEEKKISSDFLKKLSEDITGDFNKLWVAYRKMTISLKDNFILQFINNRKKALIILAENNPELVIKTISKLKCPALQFHLINKLDPIVTLKMTEFIDKYCWERVMKVLTEYYFYPQNIEPKDYFNQWEGEPYLHIKFCKTIMGSRYEQAKEFLKAKNKYENK